MISPRAPEPGRAPSRIAKHVEERHAIGAAPARRSRHRPWSRRVKAAALNVRRRDIPPPSDGTHQITPTALFPACPALPRPRPPVFPPPVCPSPVSSDPELYLPIDDDGRPRSQVPGPPSGAGEEAPAAGLRPALRLLPNPRPGPASALNDRRSRRSGLSTLRSTRAMDCQVPRARRPPITGTVAQGGTKASADDRADRPCLADPCACRQRSSAGSRSERVARRFTVAARAELDQRDARGRVRHEDMQRRPSPLPAAAVLANSAHSVGGCPRTVLLAPGTDFDGSASSCPGFLRADSCAPGSRGGSRLRRVLAGPESAARASLLVDRTWCWTRPGPAVGDQVPAESGGGNRGERPAGRARPRLARQARGLVPAAAGLRCSLGHPAGCVRRRIRPFGIPSLRVALGSARPSA